MTTPQTVACRKPAGLLAALLPLCLLCGCASHPKLNLPPTAPTAEADSFEAGANRRPTAKTLYAMATILGRQGKDVDCEWMLKRLITEYPAFAPAYSDLAELQVRQQRIDDAFVSLAGGLRVAPGDPALTNNLGMCWFIRNDYPRALEHFTRAAGAAPSNARYRSNMALALGLLGRFDESRALFEQVVPLPDVKRNMAILIDAVQKRQAAQANARETERSGDGDGLLKPTPALRAANSGATP